MEVNLKGIDINNKIIDMKKEELIADFTNIKTDFDQFEKMIKNFKKKEPMIKSSKKSTTGTRIKDSNLIAAMEAIDLDKFNSNIKQVSFPTMSLEYLENKTVKNFENLININKMTNKSIKSLKTVFMKNLEIIQEQKKRLTEMRKMDKILKTITEKIKEFDTKKDDLGKHIRAGYDSLGTFYTQCSTKQACFKYKTNPFFYIC